VSCRTGSDSQQFPHVSGACFERKNEYYFKALIMIHFSPVSGVDANDLSLWTPRVMYNYGSGVFRVVAFILSDR
jgi:hypothetical protein